MNFRFWKTWFKQAEPAQVAPAAVGPKPGMKVSYDALAYMSAKDGTPAKPYAFPTAAPGVISRTDKLACDSAMNATYAYADMNSVYSEGLAFPGFAYLAELCQRPEYRRPSEIFAKQMTRKWIELQAIGDDDKSDKLAKIEAEFKRLNVQAKFREAIEQDGFFGRSQIYIDVGVKLDDRDELRTELYDKPGKIGKNAIKCLTVIEPIWTYPNTYNSSDPLDPTFFKPQSWFVMGKEIHASRLLTFTSREVPDILKPAYAFSGLSLSQMMKPYVDNWLRTRQSVSDLVHSFTVWTLKTNLSSILNGGAAEDFFRRLQLFNRGRDNHGVNAIDKDSEDFANLSVPLGSLDKLQAQAQEQMASVTGVPLVYLTGMTPSGLNASSEGEIRVFEDWCGAQQEGYTPNVTRLINLIQLSLFGEIDDGIGFKWVPLRTESESELATTRKMEADTDVVLIEAGVLSPQESRTRIASEENSPYPGLAINDLPDAPDDGSLDDVANNNEDATA